MPDGRLPARATRYFHGYSTVFAVSVAGVVACVAGVVVCVADVVAFESQAGNVRAVMHIRAVSKIPAMAGKVLLWRRCRLTMMAAPCSLFPRIMLRSGRLH